MKLIDILEEDLQMAQHNMYVYANKEEYKTYYEREKEKIEILEKAIKEMKGA